MKAPYIVLNNLSPEQCDRWVQQFEKDGRNIAEGMWRRSHDEFTHQKFGSPINDKSRRLVHFIDKYEIIERNNQQHLAITQSYLYICSTLPVAAVVTYWQRHRDLAQLHGWSIEKWDNRSCRLRNGDYEITGTIYDIHPEDLGNETSFPANYKTVEMIVRSKNEDIPKDKRETPWGVWRSKYRRPIPRQEPKIVEDLKELLPYFPMHVELGCGPSLEAGIPPLSQLHHIYSAADYATGKFLFGKDDTLLERIITDISGFYESAAEPYRSCFLAQVTPFYELLGKLRQQGLILEPLINNNFDGLAKLVGFEELYIRRYETSRWIPDIQFDPRAKSILVVGSHADRRLVRVHARQAGLQVINVDPEGYYHKDGSFEPYPLEALDASDILVRMTAGTFAEQLSNVLKTAS